MFSTGTFISLLISLVICHITISFTCYVEKTRGGISSRKYRRIEFALTLIILLLAVFVTCLYFYDPIRSFLHGIFHSNSSSPQNHTSPLSTAEQPPPIESTPPILTIKNKNRIFTLLVSLVPFSQNEFKEPGFLLFYVSGLTVFIPVIVSFLHFIYDYIIPLDFFEYATFALISIAPIFVTLWFEYFMATTLFPQQIEIQIKYLIHILLNIFIVLCIWGAKYIIEGILEYNRRHRDNDTWEP